jgi:adenosylcobyric acid synthase
MKARILMVQGTGSHVGKSVVVAALCRILLQDGFKVAPFKAQNMSLNSYVTPDGGEIGRAQAVQAEAAGIEPTVEMNPILLKPEADSRSQAVVLGRPSISTAARDYYQMRHRLWSVVTKSLDTLRSQYDVVVIEGAGSPAEVNLKEAEIVNMRVARYCGAPVLLVGDIDRGGIFASLLGTLWLLDAEERALVKGFIINKFRGDLSLLESGLKFLESKAHTPVLGVIPYFHDIHIAQEDSVALEQPHSQKDGTHVDVAVIRLPHISNFDDFDPLEREAEVALRYVKTVGEMNTPDLLIIPGSKTTAADLDWLKESGLARKIVELYEQGVFIIGICGGYQMLGECVHDPQHVESPDSEKPGLDILPVSTTFLASKETHRVKGRVQAGWGLFTEARGIPFEGYEIHMGTTDNQEGRAAFRINERSGQFCDVLDGCLGIGGRVLGTYIHGLFHNQELRQAILAYVARSQGRLLHFLDHNVQRDDEYNRLAELVRRNLDMELVYTIAGLRKVK